MTYTTEQYWTVNRCFGCVQENIRCDDTSCEVPMFMVKKNNKPIQFGFETLQEAKEFIKSHDKNYK